MRKRVLHGGGLVVLALLGGCHLLIGYRDAVLDEDEGGAGGMGGAGGGCQVNGIEDGEETARDCGGPACPPCDDGKTCEVGADCASEVCAAGLCQPAACDDGVQNGAESDVDCGGGAASGCAGCVDGAACQAHADCISAVCKSGRCVRTLVWARQFAPVEETKLAASADGNIVFVGLSYGHVDLGGGLLLPNASDFMGARYDADGQHLWSGAFGDDQMQFATDVAIDHSGALVACGRFSGEVSFGGAPLLSAGSDDVFAVKLGVSGSQHWSARYGDAQGQEAHALAIGPQNEVIIAGTYTGTINLGGGNLPNFGFMAFVAKLNAGGVHAWSRAYQGVFPRFAAVDGVGNVFVGGQLNASTDLGGGPLPFSGANDWFVLKLSSSGSHLWSKGFSTMGLGGIAVDAAGNLLLTGAFRGVLDLTDPPMTSTGYPSDGDNDAVLLKLGPDGGPVWSRQFGGPGGASCSYPAIDPLGNIIALCSADTDESTDFGGRELHGLHIVKLDPDGNYLWSQYLGDASGGIGFADLAAPDPEHVVLLGQLHDTFDLGAGPMTSQSYGDLVLARFLVPSAP